jgi:hypothetical protein
MAAYHEQAADCRPYVDGAQFTLSFAEQPLTRQHIVSGGHDTSRFTTMPTAHQIWPAVHCRAAVLVERSRIRAVERLPADDSHPVADRARAAVGSQAQVGGAARCLLGRRPWTTASCTEHLWCRLAPAAAPACADQCCRGEGSRQHAGLQPTPHPEPSKLHPTCRCWPSARQSSRRASSMYTST